MLAEWSPGVAGVAIDLTHNEVTDDFVDRYARSEYRSSPGSRILRRVLEHASAVGARTGILEFRYVDPDWRNEHSRFYSTTFRRYPSVAHRLHFFSAGLPRLSRDPDELPDPLGLGEYIGYTVLRPTAGAPVGRTMLPPLAADRDSVSCKVDDEVHLFGTHLVCRDVVPFMMQDGQLGVCAHASVWVTAYYHHRASHHQRFLPGDVADAAPGAAGLGRVAPARGLSVMQIKEAFRGIGLPPIVHRADALPKSETVDALVCRYLNSAIPVTICFAQHTRVLVGYRTMSGDQSGRPTYIAQDDQCGPFVELSELFPQGSPTSIERPDYVVVPLPAKMYVPAENAEELGAQSLISLLADSSARASSRLYLETCQGKIAFRTVAVASNALKRTALARWGTRDGQLIRQHPMSRYVYVVQAVKRDTSPAQVLGEAIIDATDHVDDLRVLVRRTPDELVLWWPDEDAYRIFETRPRAAPLVSPALT